MVWPILRPGKIMSWDNEKEELDFSVSVLVFDLKLKDTDSEVV